MMENFLHPHNQSYGDREKMYSQTTHKHTHTTQSEFLTSFISLLGTDLMIFPAKHKDFISVTYGSVTLSLCVRPKQTVCAVCLTCSALLLYPGSRQATFCPGTETQHYEGTGSPPGADCCSAPGAAEVSAKEKHGDLKTSSI